MFYIQLLAAQLLPSTYRRAGGCKRARGTSRQGSGALHFWEAGWCRSSCGQSAHPHRSGRTTTRGSTSTRPRPLQQRHKAGKTHPDPRLVMGQLLGCVCVPLFPASNQLSLCPEMVCFFTQFTCGTPCHRNDCMRIKAQKGGISFLPVNSPQGEVSLPPHLGEDRGPKLTFTGRQVTETSLQVGCQDVLAPVPTLAGRVVSAQALLLPDPTAAGTLAPGGPGVPGAVQAEAIFALAHGSL